MNEKTKEKEFIWKPTKIPKGFVLIIDTREQRPLFLERQQELIVHRKELIVGDYSIEGFESRTCVERKQLSDFDAFIGRERVSKTIPKLEHMRQMYWAGLAIECSERKLFGERKYGKMTPEHTRGFLKIVEVRYGVHTYWAKDRVKLEQWILDRLCDVYEMLTGMK